MVSMVVTNWSVPDSTPQHEAYLPVQKGDVFCSDSKSWPLIVGIKDVRFSKYAAGMAVPRP